MWDARKTALSHLSKRPAPLPWQQQPINWKLAVQPNETKEASSLLIGWCCFPNPRSCPEAGGCCGPPRPFLLIEPCWPQGPQLTSFTQKLTKVFSLDFTFLQLRQHLNKTLWLLCQWLSLFWSSGDLQKVSNPREIRSGKVRDTSKAGPVCGDLVGQDNAGSNCGDPKGARSISMDRGRPCVVCSSTRPLMVFPPPEIPQVHLTTCTFN